ncbi:MAG: hypothetical protein H7199_02125 [Burkholderiales bacterium]|nr:hypothetical protein [Flavobacterium sp.]
MKVAIFSTKYYEREHLEKYNIDGRHKLAYFQMLLNAETVTAARGFDAISLTK